MTVALEEMQSSVKNLNLKSLNSFSQFFIVGTTCKRTVLIAFLVVYISTYLMWILVHQIIPPFGGYNGVMFRLLTRL